MSFVIVEGPNGAGKTTLIKNLSDEGYQTLSSPNGTPLAQMLRSSCRGTETWTDIDKRVRFLLFSAARLDEYIRCVAGKDEPVVADRWWTSTYIYQCCLQGIEVPFLEYTIHPQEQVDLVILLGGDPEVLIQRVIDERSKNPEHGVCTWTQEKETMLELHRLYAEKLPPYLDGRDIPCEEVDTTELDAGHVLSLSKELIGKYS